MKANEWLKPWGLSLDHEIELIGITDQSKKVKPGIAFFAIEGVLHNGNNFIDEALLKGASLVVSSEPYQDERVLYIENLESIMNEMIYRFYGNPEKNLRLIGITGTNGKTSTAWILYHAFERQGLKSLLVGTLGAICNDFYEPTQNTTPNAMFLAPLFKKALNYGVRWIIMEVSSHALMLGRVSNLAFDFTVFMNLSHEHLDFHQTMENYFQAKKTLFIQLKPSSTALVNFDDDYGKRLVSEVSGKVILFGKEESNKIKFKVEISHILGTKFTIEKRTFQSQLIHPINGYNFAAAYGIMIELGIDPQTIVQTFSLIPPVPGRFQTIHAKGVYIVIDFAHTPDAMKKILNFLNQLNHRELITVFGCGGNRDKEKRPMMGQIATSFSDYTIITNDNPRFENPMEIINEIVEGTVGPYHTQMDRSKAIAEALSMSKEGDFVAILGKGDEPYQIIGEEKIPYKDEEEVEKWISR